MSMFTTRPYAAAPVAATVAKRVVTAIRDLWRAHRNRRETMQLLNFDDRALADIGLTRGDLGAVVASGPFEDPSRRLVVLAVERRAGRLMQARERLRESAATQTTAPRTPLPTVATPIFRGA